ncbi:MAG: helix-turn-helix domain-containing protein, partial [Dehalococcoidia bacterium]
MLACFYTAYSPTSQISYFHRLINHQFYTGINLCIINLLTGKKLTSQEIAERLPEVPQATLYRHIKQLEKGGIIRITETHQIRGTVEKVYTAGAED